MTFDSLSIERAAALLAEQVVPPARGETLPLAEALGRICFDDLAAPMDQPPFDRSPLDGYALRHADLRGASPGFPARLAVTRRVFAGDAPDGPVGPGEAARVMTGAPIPPGADCVVRQEDTDGGEERVEVFCAAQAGENICARGEDLSRGAPLIGRGVRLGAAHLGVLAGQGVTGVRVFPRPRVGLLSTGDELTPPGAPLSPGKIYDGNGPYLAARLVELGMLPVDGGRCGDDPVGLARAVEGLLSRCDAVITTGGVSVGRRDHMPRAGGLLGARRLFHGVAVKPGAPLLALTVNQTPVVCLSGNPFAAAATLEAVARPMLRRLAGWRDLAPPRARGVLREPFAKASPGRRLARARIEGGDVFLPPGTKRSGALSAMMGCNCLIDIPAGSPALEPGATVEVLLL